MATCLFIRPVPSRPASFYRIIDGSTLVHVDKYGYFDTRSRLYMSLDNIITVPSFDRHLMWGHRFRLDGGSNPLMFVSLTPNHRIDGSRREKCVCVHTGDLKTSNGRRG